jgi:uncharacterized protein
MNKFVHIELNTGDVKAAKKFYKGLFDWKMTDMPMGPTTYTMLDTGAKDEGGGIQQKPMAEAPTQWLPYVQVDSVKRTISKARSRGAQIVVEYQSLGGMGALGIFVDPTGAALGVWETTAKKPAKKRSKK